MLRRLPGSAACDRSGGPGLLACGLPILLCVAPLSAAWASGEPVRSFNIPATPLAGALDAFAKQSGLQLIYPPALAEGRRARAVSGRLAPSQALQRILADSGLEAFPASDDIYVLRARTRDAPAQRPVAPQALTAAPAPTVSAPQPMHRVLVTGSRIPRVALEATTPVSIISREQIESGGFTTLFDLLRHQPGMTGHHVVEAATEDISNSLTSLVPTAVVQSASLYGLGPRGTLYLVDGRRVASYAVPSTSLGGLQDLGAIPLSMVERVEILRGGASAVYGADAVSGVVNIILRQDYEGGEIEALYGLSERGDAEIWRMSAGVGFPVASGQMSVFADHLSQAELGGTSRAWHTRDRRKDGLDDNTTPLGYYLRKGSGGLHLLPSAPCVAAADPTHPACRLDRERYRSLRPESDSNSVRVHWHRPLDAEGTTELHVTLRSARTDSRMHAAPMTFWHLPLPPGDAHRDVADAVSHAFYDVGPIVSRNRVAVFDGAAGLRFAFRSWDMNAELSHASHQVDSRVQGGGPRPCYRTGDQKRVLPL